MGTSPDTDAISMAGDAESLTSNPPIASSDAEHRAVRPLSLRRNFVWTFAGNVVYAASMWGVLVLLAKLSSPALVGQYSLAIAVVAPINILCQLQLRALQVTDTTNEYHFAQYLGLRLLGMFAAVVIASAIGIAAYERDMAFLILLAALNRGVTGCRDVFFGAMQRHERMDLLSIGQMISGILNLAVLGGAIYFTGNLYIAISAATITKLAMLVFYDRSCVSRLLAPTRRVDPSAASLRPSFAISPMWRVTKLAIPLGLVMMIVTLQSNIPTYFIEAIHGEATLGYFAAVAALLQVGTIVVGALGQSASPRLAKYYQGNIVAFGRLVAKSCAVGAAVGVAGILVAALLGRPVLTLLFTEKYAQYHNILVIIMVAGSLRYVASFFGYAMTAARRLKVQVPINIATIVAILLGSSLLIGPYGLVGAAATVVAGAAVQCFLQGLVVVKLIRRRKQELLDASGGE